MRAALVVHILDGVGIKYFISLFKVNVREYNNFVKATEENDLLKAGDIFSLVILGTKIETHSHH